MKLWNFDFASKYREVVAALPLGACVEIDLVVKA
jgi:hypothetical protein